MIMIQNGYFSDHLQVKFLLSFTIFPGRSVQLKNHLSGLLLNPNGKFEANFIPFNTMSEWYAADADAPEANGSI